MPPPQRAKTTSDAASKRANIRAMLRERLPHYVSLLRLNKPIGIFLLLWPTLWALWLAGRGCPSSTGLWVFLTGTVLMRSAGCVLNDFADRNFDGQVARTKNRPLASGKVSSLEALLLAATLALLAFALVWLCNILTIALAVVGAVLAATYPFLKRITHLPQLGLGLAFTWGVPMAFAAETGTVTYQAWFLFVTGAIWPIIYDTMYAMVDKKDDQKIGVKSAAILFNTMDRLIIGLLQILFLVMLVMVGFMFNLHNIYYVCLTLAGVLFLYQQWLIKNREVQKCFQAFMNNHWVGLIVFVGIWLGLQ